MKTINTRFDWSKPLSISLVTGAIIIAPILTVADAQAAPPDRIPSDVYRGNNRNNNRDNNNDYVTLTGVVTRDVRGSQFLFRGDDGRNYIADIDRGREPGRLSVGDRVEVRGRLDNALVQNATVRILSNSNNGNDYGDGSYGGQRTVNFPGTVVRVNSKNTLRVRGDNGQEYEITTKDRLASSIRDGSRVRVSGQANGFYVTGAYVTGEGSADVYRRDDNNSSAGNIDFNGTVESTSLTSFRVRGDNGQVYEVQYRGSILLRRDQRVRVRGTFDGRIVTASNVDNL